MRLGETGSLLATVAVSVLVIEAVVALLLFPRMLIAGVAAARRRVAVGLHLGDGVHQHRLPARPREGLAPYADDVWFLTVLMIGVFFGAIGFPVIYVLRAQPAAPASAGRCT